MKLLNMTLITTAGLAFSCTASDQDTRDIEAGRYTEGVLREPVAWSATVDVQDGEFLFDTTGKLRRMVLWLDNGDKWWMGTEPTEGKCDLIMESPYGDISKEAVGLTQGEQQILLHVDGDLVELRWDYLLTK